MKRLVLISICLILVAGIASAATPKGPRGNRTDLNGDGFAPNTPREPADIPVRPAPEPGTMALASMGLMALGAAARKRWQR